MIERILKFSIHYPLAIILFTLVITGFGIYSFIRLPIDAVPDITNNQVQINTTLEGSAYNILQSEVVIVMRQQGCHSSCSDRYQDNGGHGNRSFEHQQFPLNRRSICVASVEDNRLHTL